MKKLFGLCAVLALITGGVVLSDEVRSIVEQNANPDAVQAVESAVEDSVSQPLQEALPEQEAPEQSESPVLTPSEAVENALPVPDSSAQPNNPPFILGVRTSPVPPMVRAQINLPGESGLFVQTIKPNGPAAKAGVLPFDIIVSIDGIAITNTNDLSVAIQKAAGKPQKLTVLRHGKELTLDVTAQPADIDRQPGAIFSGAPVQQFFIDPMAPNYDPDDDEDVAPWGDQSSGTRSGMSRYDPSGVDERGLRRPGGSSAARDLSRRGEHARSPGVLRRRQTRCRDALYGLRAYVRRENTDRARIQHLRSEDASV